ncbi:H1 protein, partial [Hypocryptadius cinnamomeus]|nr:H1 protein [Hypocryptadius cinnamomeus]
AASAAHTRAATRKLKKAARGSKAREPAGPSVTKAVSAPKQRRGLSLATLAAGGYDMEKSKSRIKLGLKSLISNGTPVQSKGIATSGSFKLNKKPGGTKERATKKKTAAKPKKLVAKKPTSAAKKPTSAAKKPTSAAKKPTSAAKKPKKAAAVKKSPKKAKKPAATAAKKAAKSPKRAAEAGHPKKAVKSPAKVKVVKPKAAKLKAAKPKAAKAKKAVPKK